MASTTYEPIMAALLAKLKAACGNTFLTYERGIKTIDDLAQRVNATGLALRQPALFLFDGIGFGGGLIHYEQRGRGRPTVRIMSRSIIVYARAFGPGGAPDGTPRGPAPDVTGGQVFHPLIEAVEAAFRLTDSEGALTLGGLVSHCWIEGEGHLLATELDPVNGQGMATLPIKIMVP